MKETFAPCLLKESSHGIQQVSLDSELYAQRRIFLTEEVTAATMNALLMQLMCLENDESKEPVTLYINSPGGSVVCGLAVYDYIRMMKKPVITVCTGIAASMGSILFLASDTRKMLPHTKIMIHDPSFGGGSLAGMKPDTLQEHLNDLKQTRDIMVRIIAERTGQPLEKVREYTRDDSYFDAQEALKFGLATEIIGSTDEREGR